MLVKNCTSQEISEALAKTNEQFAGNIIFKRFDYAGRTRRGGEKYRVTLTVKDSRAPGSRISTSGRRVAAACWHAHGTFFDSLPSQAVIDLGNGEKTYPGARWVDRSIGSYFQPMLYSEACDCGLTPEEVAEREEEFKASR